MTNKIEKLKKYLFMISVVFFSFSLFHLISVFLYHDAKLEAVPGGSISEWIIGNFPHLNPLKNGTENDKYILSLLYRSLLKYDIENGKIVSDIANCDISNITYIECYLKDNMYWSNGEPITTADIVSTYTLLKNTEVNPIAASLLQDTTIEQNDSVIIFNNTKEDVNYLNIFFQPIAPKQLLDTITEEQLTSNFSWIDEVYSGQYVIKNISQDQTIGITKIVLEKNFLYTDNPILIDQLVLKIFPNISTFLKNKESVNIFNDTSHIISNSIPRLEKYSYILPQYVSLFINQENIPSLQIRSAIWNAIQIAPLLETLWENNFTGVSDPYLDSRETNNAAVIADISSAINELGYYRKKKIIADFERNFKNQNTISNEASTQTGSQNNTPESIIWSIKDLSQLNSIDDFQEPSITIQEPTFIEKYNFITKDDIVLKGRVLEWTQAVYVNDYKLTGFEPGDTFFAYRLRESFQNIIEGKNIYSIYFELIWENGELEKRSIEDITILYHKNKAQLEQATEELFQELKAWEIEKQNILQKQKELEEQTSNTLKQENIEYITQINALNKLDDSLYYNDDGEIFSLNFYYIDTEKELQATAEYIETVLWNMWIQLNMFPVSVNGLVSVLDNKNAYDIMLAGVNLWYFDDNIFPYFHSSQVKNGYNFSQIRKTSLDILLEELKSDIVNADRAADIKKKIINILNEEKVIKTLYTPNVYLLVDKKIKNIRFPEYVPFWSLRWNVLDNIYIQEKKYIQFENKSVWAFFKFLAEKIYE